MLQHRLFPVRVALLWLALTVSAHAAELGEARVQSFIGQPLRAEVELIGISADDARNLTVRQASPDIYKQANIRADPALASLRLTVEQRDGRSYLRATSATPVEAPYLHVFVELPSASAHVVRAFTFWLAPAPPGTLPETPPAVSAPVVALADKPKAKPTVKPAAKPAKPAQPMLTDDDPVAKTATAGGKPAPAAADKAIEKAADKTPPKAADKAGDATAVKATAKPGEKGADAAPLKVAGKPGEKPAEKPQPTSAAKAAEKAAEKPADKHADGAAAKAEAKAPPAAQGKAADAHAAPVPAKAAAETATPKPADKHGETPVKAVDAPKPASPPAAKALDKPADKAAGPAKAPDPHGAAPAKGNDKHGDATPVRPVDKPVDKAVDKPVDKAAAHGAPPVLALAGGKTPDGCPAAPPQFSRERITQCLVAETENAAINAHLGALEVTVAKLKQAILAGGPIETSAAAAQAANTHAGAAPAPHASAVAISPAAQASVAPAEASAAPAAGHAIAASAHGPSTPAAAAASASSGSFLKLRPVLDKNHANDWIWKVAAPAALSAIALFGGLLFLLKRRAKARAVAKGSLDDGGGDSNELDGASGDDGAADTDQTPPPNSKRGKRATKSKSGTLAKIKLVFGKIGRSKKKAAAKADPIDAPEAE